MKKYCTRSLLALLSIFFPFSVFASSLQVDGTLDMDVNLRGIAVQDTTAYITAGLSGLKIVSITNPSVPTLTSTYDTTGSAIDVDVSGNYAYVAGATSGVQVIDVTDPAAPALVSTVNTDGSAVGIDVVGNYAYVSDSTHGLVIIDISDPLIPVTVGNYDTDGTALGVFVSGNTAYIADGGNGAVIIDISDVTAPQLISIYPGENAVNYQDIVAGSGVMYVTDDDGSGVGQLHLIDISDSATPVSLSTFDFFGTPDELSLEGNYVYFVAGDGVQVVNVSNSSTPTLSIASDDALLAGASGITHVGHTLYVNGSKFNIVSFDADGDNVTEAEGDCNDDDSNVSSEITFYADTDGDGLGDSQGTTVLCQITAPAGFVTNDDDTNDTDADNDGVETDVDCNDEDVDLSSNETYYVDADGDGLGSDVSEDFCAVSPPTGYVENSTDTNDTIINDGVEINGDSVDNDSDGVVDEVNTLAENGIHPGYGGSDATSKDVYAASVIEIAGLKNGRIKVTFADNSVYRYDVYDIDTDSKTIVKSYNSKGYLVVLQPKGKKLALLNVYTGEIVSTKKLSDNKYKDNAFKVAKVRDKYVVVVTSKKDSSVLLSLVKVKLSEESFKKKSQVNYSNSGVSVTKTEPKDKKINLRNSDKTVLKTYTVTEDFDLKEE